MGKPTPCAHESIAEQTDVAVKAPSRKKDTKRWCKGKPGRRHVAGPVEIDPYFDVVTHSGKRFDPEQACGPQAWGAVHFCHHVVRCTVCNKKLIERPSKGCSCLLLDERAGRIPAMMDKLR